MGTELIVAEKLNTEVLFTKDGELDKAMAMIRQRLDDFEPDLSTAAGRKEVASMSRKVSSSKAFLDGIRKEQNAKAKKEIDGRNGLWKPAREELDELRDKTRQPLTDWEDSENLKDEERIAAIRSTIDGFKELYFGFNGTGTVEQLQAVIIELEAVSIEPEDFFEFTTEAEDTIKEIQTRASQDLETRKRLDQEEADRKIEGERLAKIAKEQEAAAAKLKAQQDVIDAENLRIKEEYERIDREKDKADKRKFEIRLNSLKRVSFDGELIFDVETKETFGTHDAVMALTDSEFEKSCTAHNDMIDKRESDRAEQEKKDQAEFERNAIIKATEDAKFAAEQAEKDRVSKVKADELEKKRLAAILPDKEKFSVWVDSFENIPIPDIKDVELRDLLTDTGYHIATMLEDALEKAQSM